MKPQTGHTPGLWTVEECREVGIFNNSYWIAAPDNQGFDDGDKTIICRLPTGMGKYSAQFHNANLLAQAPAMLIALKAWESFWNAMPKGQLGNVVCDIGLLNEAFIQTRAAIAMTEVAQ